MICPQHRVNPGGCIGCTKWSLQYYTVADTQPDSCTPCPTGTIRQASSEYNECEPCPSLFALSNTTQQCQLCILPADLYCPGQETGQTYVDDCSVQNTNTENGCVCGCRQCTIHSYVNTVENFMLFPGCHAGCVPGYKLRYFSDTTRIPALQCVANHKVLLEPEFVLFSNGYYKMTNLNSTDMSVKQCYKFFSLSLSQIESILHITPSIPTFMSSEFIHVNNSILSSYITNPQELTDIDKSCFSRCLTGYTAKFSLLTKIFECVPQPSTSQCTTNTPKYRLTSCTTHGV